MPPLIKLIGVAALAASLASCGGGSDSAPDGGGIIGTGIQLRGTVPTNRQFADASIGIKAASGERSTAAIANNGRFSVDDAGGEGPFLFKVDLGNGNSYYSVAHDLDAGAVTQNVHAFSDLAIRNWFATQGADIDAAFASDGAISNLPSVAQIGSVNSLIQDLMSESLAAYGLAGTDLSTVSFDANDTGVDRFLDRNPVLINNGNITIIIADPETDTQSIVTSGLPVNTDLTAVDTLPPSAPGALRVLPSATDEIVLAWDSATDNIGVVLYEVMRDGVVIATTPFPTLIDSPLASGITFEYAVVALDAAGNRSTTSATGSSATLAAPDTTPPPAATALSLVPGADNIVVSWSQSGIADVASFRVLRGEGRTMLVRLGRVTSTSFTDGGLNSGVEYCYQIVTNDASENESAPSEIVCATTSGSVVTTQPTVVVPPVVTPPMVTPPSGPVSTDGLLAVDVSALACTSELESSSITTVVTLNEPCYQFARDLNVQQGGQLIVQAGTVLKFASGATLNVREGASLTANGTAAQPVVFSALDPTSGSWGGIYYDRSNSTRNVLNSTVIEFGGSASGAGLRVRGFTASPARLSVNGVLVRNSAGDGINFSNSSLLDEVSGLIVTQNARSGTITATVAADLGSDTILSGNTVDGLQIGNSTVSSPTVWPMIDVPYLVDILTIDAPLSIPAGAQLRFESNGGVNVRTAGSLSAIGTAQAPILFTGAEPTPGYWTGISLDQTNSTNNRFEHVVVEYGGTMSINTAGIRVRGFSSAPSRVVIKDTILRFSQGFGFRLSSDVALDEFVNVTSTSNGFSGTMSIGSVGSIGAGNDFQGNTEDGIEFSSVTVSVATTVPAVNVPYRFDDINVNAPLTLSPGVTFLANSGAEFDIGSDGALNAVGTAAQPITIAGRSSLPGFWDGIEFSQSNSVLNVLDFVNISDGGSGPLTTGANIGMRCFSSGPSRLSVSNSSISNSAAWGIFLNSDNCITDFASSNTFSNNAAGDINVP